MLLVWIQTINTYFISTLLLFSIHYNISLIVRHQGIEIVKSSILSLGFKLRFSSLQRCNRAEKEKDKSHKCKKFLRDDAHQ